MKSSANRLPWASFGRLAVSAIMLLASLCCLNGVVWAQSTATGGQIVGQVLDSSGAAIAGAEVTVRNKNTNSTRTVTSDEAGRFAVPQLAVGPYEVKATASGFEPAAQELIITLGSTVAANFSMSVGATGEVVEVSGGVTELAVDPSRTSSQSVITDVQIRELPANGRRFQDFILLTPQVQTEPARGGLSISGQRGINVNINIDGADYNQPFFGGIRGGERSNNAFTVSQEAIQEFQVARNSFSAEFGRSTGAVVNVVTKSGGNAFHGSAFYLFRNEELTAEDALQRKPLAQQKQFGGSISGPIIKDRTFFFSALDFQKAEEPLQVKFTAIDTQKLRNTPGANALIGVAPEEEFLKTNDAQAVLGRVDHRLFKNNNLSARFNYSNNKGENASSAGGGVNTFTNTALSNNGIERDRTYTTVIQLTSILTNNLINEARFQYSREERPRENNSDSPQVTVRNAGATVGIYGKLSFLPSQQFDDRYQVTNNVSLVKGAHTAKFGFDFNRVFVDQIFRNFFGGAYEFNSFADFLARKPSLFRQFAGTGAFSASQKELAFYVQDEWRIRPGLTLSPGFRYEATFNPDLINFTRPELAAPQAKEIPDDTRQFAPRMGVAWDIRNNGKTVVRFGGGLFYARTPLLLFNNPIVQNGGRPEVGLTLNLTSQSAVLAAFQRFGINLANAPLGNLPIFNDSQLSALTSGPVGAGQAFYFDQDFRNPRSSQFNVAVEREIARGLLVTTDFAYINTTRLERMRDDNLNRARIDPATGRRIFDGARPNPRFSSVFDQESSSHSLYRAFTVSVNFRRSRYVLDAYYTLSSNYSDDDNERTSGGTAQVDDQLNFKNEFFFNNLDQRHQFNVNGAINLPYGFQISGTSRFASARPLNARVGSDVNRDGNAGGDRPIINGRTIKRNAFRDFSVSNVSMRLQKSFNLPSDRGKISASIEMFNLFNFDNATIGSGNQVFGEGTRNNNGQPQVVAPPLNFRRLRDDRGRYLTSNNLGDPFQVQIGFRYTF